MNKNKTNEISTIYGREKLKVTCIERRYRVEDSKVTFIVNARKELDEDTTSKLLHEDMELKTFLANYEITDIAPRPAEIENVETLRRKTPAKNELKTVLKHKIRTEPKPAIQNIMRRGSRSSFKNVQKDEMENVQKDEMENVQKDEVENVQKDEMKNVQKDEMKNVQKDEMKNVPKDEVENVQKDEVENVQKDEMKNVPREQIRKTVTKRRRLFDTLVLPEEFRAKDYAKAIEEKGMKITNDAMPYDDLGWLEKQGKIVMLDKVKNGSRIYKIVKKNGEENNREELMEENVQ